MSGWLISCQVLRFGQIVVLSSGRFRHTANPVSSSPYAPDDQVRPDRLRPAGAEVDCGLTVWVVGVIDGAVVVDGAVVDVDAWMLVVVNESVGTGTPLREFSVQ